MKRLVIMADDYGLSASVTRGILHCLDRGTISDVSVMPNGAFFNDGVKLLRRRGITHAGVHLSVVDGETPVSSSSRINRLLGPDGRFVKHRNRLLLASAVSRTVRRQLEKEFRAQMDRLCRAGLGISHISSHQHVHMFPPIGRLIADLAREYQVPFVRITRTRTMPVGAALEVFGTLLKPHLRNNRIDWLAFFGMEVGDGLTCPAIYDIISRIDSNTAEFMVHPGWVDPETSHRYRHWQYKWPQTCHALNDDTTGKLLEDSGISLVSFRDLAISTATEWNR